MARLEASKTGAVPKKCPIKAARIDREGHTRGYWAARVPVDHELTDVFADGYFADLLSLQAPPKHGDEIEIENEGMTWWARCRVLAVVPQIKVIRVVELERHDFSVEPPPGFKFEWAGAQDLWRVRKGATIVATQCFSQHDCMAAIESMRATVESKDAA